MTQYQDKPITRMIQCIEFSAMLSDNDNITLTIQKPHADDETEVLTYDKNAQIFILNNLGQTIDRITQASLKDK